MEKFKLKRKPCCPKEFFAKLYGHLEDKKELKEDCFEKDTTLSQYFVSSRMMERFVKIQRSNESLKKLEIDVNSKEIAPTLPLFSSALSNTDFSYRAKAAAFATGITAFMARKRRKEGKPRRQRTTFSNEQTITLELEYNRNEYVTRGRRFELADSLGLTETQVKIWFQNRRARDKRIEKAQIDQHYRNILQANRTNKFLVLHNTFCGPWFNSNKLHLNQYNHCYVKDRSCDSRNSTQTFSFSITNE